MARVIHFDLAAPDPERAKQFYEAAFDWTVQKWDGPMEYWLITTGPETAAGIDGGLGRGEARLTEGDLTLAVDSVDDAVQRVIANGGSVAREKSPVPGVGYLAYIDGPDGNRFGLMQLDATAGR